MNSLSNLRRLWIVVVSIVALLTGCDNEMGQLGPGEEKFADNEREVTAEIIEVMKQITVNRSDGDALRRFNQPKSLGCFDAEFHIKEQLDPNLTRGIFAQPGIYPARIRFANASKFDDRKKDFRGMSIKVSGLTGEPLWGAPGTQDFVLNSHPALFAATPEEFLAFTRAMEKGRLWSFFINPYHWGALRVVLEGRRKIQNPFAIRYWSTTPYRFGTDQSVAVKYSVQPCSVKATDAATEDDENFLTAAMKRHLEGQPACFDFMVQFQKSPADMPIEDASVEWDEQSSPFQKVATIKINNQPFDSQQSMLACERISFNPWQCFQEHQPLGGINRVRKVIYEEMAQFRNHANAE
ncbi:MAG: catalase family protein [Arenicellales bacterium]